MDLFEICKSKVKAQVTSCGLVSAVQDLTLAGLLGPVPLSVSLLLFSPLSFPCPLFKRIGPLYIKEGAI